MYVEGSYFGDSDIFINKGKDGRDGSTFADCESHLLVIGKKELFTILKDFKNIKQEMIEVAQERKNHHDESIRKVLAMKEQRLMLKGTSTFTSMGSTKNILNKFGISHKKNKIQSTSPDQK